MKTNKSLFEYDSGLEALQLADSAAGDFLNALKLILGKGEDSNIDQSELEHNRKTSLLIKWCNENDRYPREEGDEIEQRWHEWRNEQILAKKGHPDLTFYESSDKLAKKAGMKDLFNEVDLSEDPENPDETDEEEIEDAENDLDEIEKESKETEFEKENYEMSEDKASIVRVLTGLKASLARWKNSSVLMQTPGAKEKITSIKQEIQKHEEQLKEIDAIENKPNSPEKLKAMLSPNEYAQREVDDEQILDLMKQASMIFPVKSFVNSRFIVIYAIRTYRIKEKLRKENPSISDSDLDKKAMILFAQELENPNSPITYIMNEDSDHIAELERINDEAKEVYMQYREYVNNKYKNESNAKKMKLLTKLYDSYLVEDKGVKDSVIDFLTEASKERTVMEKIFSGEKMESVTDRSNNLHTKLENINCTLDRLSQWIEKYK